MLRYLLKKAYVRKISRGIYEITEKGKKQLKVWKENNEEN